MSPLTLTLVSQALSNPVDMSHRRFTPDTPHKQEFSEYMYQNFCVQPSGDFGLFRLLKPVAYAHHPLLERIHKLKVPGVSLIYGDHDWMDVKAGFHVQEICDTHSDAPKCDVYTCTDSGHQLMLDAPENFAKCVRVATFSSLGLTTQISEADAATEAQSPPFHLNKDAQAALTGNAKRPGRF